MFTGFQRRGRPIMNTDRSVSSLKHLEPGDHIQVKNFSKPPRQRWREWFWSRVGSGSPGCSAATVISSHHHMMVVRKPTAEDKVHVIHMTEEGVKEHEVPLSAKDVKVLEYQCQVTAEEAIENARASFDEQYDPKYNNDEQFVTRAKVKLVETTCIQEVHAPSESKPLKVLSISDLKEGDHIEEQFTNKHDLLVVKVLDGTRIRVIHKLNSGFVEEIKCYRPSKIRVFHYECPFSGEEIVRRARDIAEVNEPYNPATSNCEHFVREARTGRKESFKAKKVATSTSVGILGGAAVGSGVGAMVGSVPGAVLGGVIGGVVGGAGGLGGGVAMTGVGSSGSTAKQKTN